MSIIFFEGFNHSNNDTVKMLDRNYWTPSNNATLTYSTGRTNNALYFTNFPVASGVSNFPNITLSNFSNPMVSGSMGLGFSYNRIASWATSTTASITGIPLLSVRNSGDEVLRVSCTNVPFSSTSSTDIALEISQSGVQIGTYKFSDVVGYTYTLTRSSHNSTGTSTSPGTETTNRLSREVYLEFYISSSGAGIRVDGLDMVNSSGNFLTPLTNSISSVDSLIIYSNIYIGTSAINSTIIDDLYLKTGSTVSNTLLGTSVKIHRTPLVSFRSASSPGWAGTAITNDGDNSFMSTSTADSVVSFYYQSNPTVATSVGGIKLSNTARKLTQDVSFVNFYVSGNTTGFFNNIYNVDSTIYKDFQNFYFKNPINNQDWKIENFTSNSPIFYAYGAKRL